MIRFPPRRIVVPADLSAPSLAALRTACALARRSGGSVTAFYGEMLPPSLLGFDGEGAEEISRQFDEFRAWREARLRREAEGFPAARLHVRTLHGAPQRAAARLAKGIYCDLIVMGTHGRRGFDRLASGSVAESVISASRVPVLVVRSPGETFRPRRILCPVNLTPHADDALRSARLVVGGLGARLTVLLVCEPRENVAIGRERLLARLASVLGRHWPKYADAHVRRGDPRTVILAEAAAHDLVVMSAHRKPTIGGWMLGSTADRILRYCSVPVLAIPVRRRVGVRLF